MTVTRLLTRRHLPTVIEAPCAACLGSGTITVEEQRAATYATHDHGYELVAVEEPCPECRGTGTAPARVRRAA